MILFWSFSTCDTRTSSPLGQNLSNTCNVKTSETRWIDNFQYLAIYINRKIAQWHSKFAKVGPKNSKHYVHKLSKICQKFKIFSKWRKFAKSGHNEWDPNRHSLNVRSTHCLNPSTHPHTASVRAASQDTTFLGSYLSASALVDFC